MGEEEGEKREYNLGILILLVILCWPAALIYYFTRPKVKPKQLRICTGCGRQIPFEYNVCPYCGKSVKIETAPVAVHMAPPPAGGKFCPHCGARVDPTAKFCQSCGKQLSS